MKISIITASRNNAATIRTCIQSVISQSYRDIEYIVIDGQSTDNTLQVINQYKKHINKLIIEPPQGVYQALNKGISLATGEIIALLHADDLFANKHVVENVINQMIKHNVDALYGDLQYVSKTNTNHVIRYWKSGKFQRKKLKYGWMPPHPALFVRKQIYDKSGCFDTTYKISADYDFMLRILMQKKLTIVYLPKILVIMRYGGKSNRSLHNILIKMREDYNALKQNHAGGIVSLLHKNLRKIPQFFTRNKPLS